MADGATRGAYAAVIYSEFMDHPRDILVVGCITIVWPINVRSPIVTEPNNNGNVCSMY